MKKSTKGFTLVELLAAIIILGIISVFAIPQIVGLLGSSRNRMYVSDAQKLITQAQYKMRSTSTIEKPRPNDCIVFSLLYLNTPDFDVAPNGGKYQKNNSFVIVKNDNGKLDYAVVLVEKTKKNSYIGIDLITEKSLNIGSAASHITGFQEDELIDVEADVTKDYINGKIGGYLPGNIMAIYNNPDLADGSSFDINSSMS